MGLLTYEDNLFNTECISKNSESKQINLIGLNFWNFDLARKGVKLIYDCP